MSITKKLTPDQLYKRVYTKFLQTPDQRKRKSIKLADYLMSAFAIFSLKDPSLLQFDRRKQAEIETENIKKIYHIETIPSDSALREELDQINPKEINKIHNEIIKDFEKAGYLEKMKYMEKYYLTPIDGTGSYSSTTIKCECCMKKKRTKTGIIEYYHQTLGAAIVNPDIREVIPLPPEPITKQDGATKNDCEHNATKRILKRLNEDYSHLSLIITGDNLSANAKQIQEIEKYKNKYIIVAKKTGNKYLFEQVEKLKKENSEKIQKHEFKDKKGFTHTYYFINDLPLNESNKHVRVNFIHYIETNKKGKKKTFSWITNFVITQENAFQIIRGGRARWKIENETFNTLKNQGYNFEHNFGHGKKYLAKIFIAILMLVFLVDQILQMTYKLFEEIWKKLGSKRAIWEAIRGTFRLLKFNSMNDIYKVIMYGIEGQFIIKSNTS